MTSKETIIKAITILRSNYQNSFKNTEKEDLRMLIDLWADMFKDTPEKDFNQAIKNIINTSDYFPTIAQIKKEIAIQKTRDIPQAEDEWAKVLDAVHKYGSYNEHEAMANLKPYTAYIVSHIGYMNICMSTDNTWNKKEFIAEYEQMKDKEIELLQLGETQNAKMIPSIKMLEE